MKAVSAMPVSFRYSSAGGRSGAGPAVALARERVGDLADQRERRRLGERVEDAVAASGISSMSDSSMPCQPRIEEPSKPRPSSNADSSKARDRQGQCCHVPSRSQNFRSTSCACVWPAHSNVSWAPAFPLRRSQVVPRLDLRRHASPFGPKKKAPRTAESPEAPMPPRAPSAANAPSRLSRSCGRRLAVPQTGAREGDRHGEVDVLAAARDENAHHVALPVERGTS